MTPADALADLRDGARWQTANVDRPRRLRLDSDGSGVSVEIPGPRVLALVYAGPLLAEEADLFRSGGALLERRRGTDAAPEIVPLADVRRRLWDALTALPGRPEAGRPYDDLRRFVEAARSDTVGAYLDDVLRSLRASLPAYKARASAPATRGRAKTVGERKAEQRMRDREAEETTAEWALRRWYGVLDDPDADADDRPPVGGRMKPAEVYDALVPAMEEAAETFGEEDRDEWPEIAEDEGYPLRPKVPGPRTFYAVATRLLGATRHVHGYPVYRIPDTLKETPRMFDEITQETAALKAFSDEAERYLRLRAALEEQRERLGYRAAPYAATGTDGAQVVDLAARRTARC